MIFIGIGSNLSSKFGNKIKNIELAISLLKQEGINILKKSSFYETYSQPNIQDPKFVNIVISVSTKLQPTELMELLLNIEKKLGRKRGKKNSPRTCDLDILDFNGIIKDFNLEKTHLSIPHKNMADRNFVLYPLKEISTNWIHPKTKKKISDLIDNLNNSNNEITKLSENDIKDYAK
tara:strand:+ start:10007 stop:10537 length:531 start_codon:yes stop_codon:yes gene_type:complete